MENKDTDIFESTQSSRKSENFRDFLSENDNPFVNFSKKENLRHLNDYDSNIMKDGAYKDISDDIFRLEYKISRAEKEISGIEAQISAATEINDSHAINKLQQKLSLTKAEYQELLLIYNDKNLSTKITGSFLNIIKSTTGKNIIELKSGFTDICNKIASKLPERLTSVFKIKKSLNILENINKSVDELVTMTVPYGENTDRYQQLSKYIIKANSIQAEISNYLNKNN